MRHLPNAVTLARLAGLPVLLGLLLAADGPTSAAAAWLFAALATTDLLDGILARALDARTRLGRVLDPLVDRLLVAVGLVGILLLDRLHPSGPALLLARDALAVAGFAWMARRGRDPRVDAAGKASSALVMVAVGLALLADAAWIDGLFWAAVALSILTLVNYAARAPRAARAAAASRK